MQIVKKVKDGWIIQKSAGQKKAIGQFILRGAPDDRGVLNVGGRVGAAQGPAQLKKILGGFATGILGALDQRLILLGNDCKIEESLLGTHHKFAESITEDYKNNLFPIVVGGGHDYGYSQLLAASKFFGKEKIALINIDAHLDMRPVENGLITSGSPYWISLEEKIISGRNITVFGLQEHCNQKNHISYANKHKCKILLLKDIKKKSPVEVFKTQLKKLEKEKLKIILSLDLDAIQMASCPGVSAPQADGFLASDVLDMMRIAGESKSVVGLGIFELAPALDIADSTCRTAATAIHHFCSARSAL